MQPLRLSLLICTINDRIESVPQMLLPQRNDVEYVVSFQYTDPMFLDMVPDALRRRSDVHILPFLGAGLSANRNNALRHCSTALAVIADDDARYTEADLSAVIRLAEAHPDVDIFCLQANTSDGRPFKSYAPRDFDYAHAPRGTYFTSFEIVVRTDAALPAFDTRFGLGAEFLSCGEEEIFLYQAYRSGLHVHFFPQLLCTVPSRETTGSRFAADTKVRRSKGAVLYMMHGIGSALIRITLTALRHRPWRDVPKVWRDMVEGARYVLTHPLNEGVGDEIPLDFQPIDVLKLP